MVLDKKSACITVITLVPSNLYTISSYCVMRGVMHFLYPARAVVILLQFDIGSPNEPYPQLRHNIMGEERMYREPMEHRRRNRGTVHCPTLFPCL